MKSESLLMDITVNGEHYSIDTGTTIASLVERYARTARGIAVAIDGTIVPKSMWTDTVLREGYRVEIITAVAGG